MPPEQSGHAHAAALPLTDPLQVTVIRDPDDLPATAAQLGRCNDPDRGVLVIRPLPYTTSPGDFTLAVAHALGKALPAAPTPRRWAQTVAWTAGYQLRHLVLDRAHTVHPACAPHLRELLGPARPDRPRLWLIDASHTLHRSVLTEFRGAPDTEVTVTGPAGLDQLRARPAHPRALHAVGRVPDDLPADNVMTFRAACARFLDPDTAAYVDDLWLRSFRAAREWVAFHRDITAFPQSAVALALPLSARLAARIYAAPTHGEALLELRATQAGLLREGLLLHHRGLPAGGALGHRLTFEAVSAINRVMPTREAAAAVLYLLFPYDRRGAEAHWHPDVLRLEDIGPAAAHVKIAGIRVPVPVHARPALIAHLHLRHHQGARCPTDPFFDATRPHRDARQLAQRALAHTTAATDPRPDGTDILAGPGTVWMRQRHLALRNLVGPTRRLDLSTPTWT